MNEFSDNNWHSLSDTTLLKMIGMFIQHHRLRQNKSQDDVASAANMSRSTISLLERGEKVNLNSVIQVLRILNLLYIMDVFKISNQISPIEYAKLQKNKRRRASSKNDNQNEASEW